SVGALAIFSWNSLFLVSKIDMNQLYFVGQNILMKRLEEIRDENKVKEYLKRLFISALQGSDPESSATIESRVDKILKSIEVIRLGSGEFVVSKGLFEITFQFAHLNNVNVIIRRITLKE